MAPQDLDHALRVTGFLDHDLDQLAADLLLELLGGTASDGLALVDHDDVVGQPVGFVEVLRGQQRGRPTATSSSISAHTDWRLRGSRPVVGSSKNRTEGRAIRLMAMSSRRRMPPE